MQAAAFAKKRAQALKSVASITPSPPYTLPPFFFASLPPPPLQGGAALRVRGAGGQDRLGRGAPSVPPQNIDGPQEPHAHAPAKGRPFWVYQDERVKVRKEV